MKDQLFSESKNLTLVHTTDNKELRISHNPIRLIPHSVSCNKYGFSEWVEGKNKFIISIKDESKILNLDAHGNFYDFGERTDSPINRGKAVYKYAIDNDVDIVKVKNVPAIGTEYCLLNLSCVKEYYTKKKVWDKEKKIYVDKKVVIG